ncbi:MAG TPA: fumarylacetoacetase [Phycisphaerales bacterium]|nr:fumarylacetoacetase [Phycisphaerales bacterium]
MVSTPSTNETHDPGMRSWVESANDPATEFPIQSLPFCSFIHPEEDLACPGVRIGDKIVDLGLLAEAGIFEHRHGAEDDFLHALEEPAANGIAALGPAAWSALRRQLQAFLREGAPAGGQRTRRVREKALLDADDLQFLPPSVVANYTDFYASVHHATTVGSMFRPDNPLLPNYKWVPIGYHGRASSVVSSGAPVRRPKGQLKKDDAPGEPVTPPAFGPCAMLDYELEIGVVIGAGNEMGEPIAIGEAGRHIFGLCLVNDWSARDIQKWEYQPLGPFLAKNFATTMAPYIVTAEALAPFRCPAFKRPAGDPAPLPYLADESDAAAGGFDVTLEVSLASAAMREKGLEPVRISRSRAFRDMYWTFAQMITHHASNGCNLLPGDLLASGTVSGPEPETRGCLLELTWQGRDGSGKPLPRKPIELPTGEKRTFLADGDEVSIRGFCEREGFRRVGFGECRGVIEAAE